MDIKDAILKRRSVRDFKSDHVSDEIIEELLIAAMAAPSACNKCPWEFYVVKSEEALKEVKKASMFSRYNAPLAIVVCGNLKKALPLKMADYWIHDCSAATENILLRAVDLGLGSCWCGAYPQEKVVERLRKVLNLDNHIVPLNIILLGYPVKDTTPRSQYVKEKVHYI